MAMPKRLLTATVATVAVTAVTATTIVSANAATSPDPATRLSAPADPSFATASRVDLAATGKGASVTSGDCYLDVTELSPAIPAGSGWNGIVAVDCHDRVATNISIAAATFVNGIEDLDSYYGGDVPQTSFAYAWTRAVPCAPGANQLVASALITWSDNTQEFTGVKYGPPKFC